MKFLVALASASALLASAAMAQDVAGPAAPATPAAAPAANAKLSAESTLAALMANEAAKAVLAKHIPMVVEFLDSGAGADFGIEEMSLAALSELPEAQDQGGLTAEVMTKITADLSAL